MYIAFFVKIPLTKKQRKYNKEDENIMFYAATVRFQHFDNETQWRN